MEIWTSRDSSTHPSMKAFAPLDNYTKYSSSTVCLNDNDETCLHPAGIVLCLPGFSKA